MKKAKRQRRPRGAVAYEKSLRVKIPKATAPGMAGDVVVMVDDNLELQEHLLLNAVVPFLFNNVPQSKDPNLESQAHDEEADGRRIGNPFEDDEWR